MKKIITIITLFAFLFGPSVRPSYAYIPLLLGGKFVAASLASWIEASAIVHAVAGAGAYVWAHSRGVSDKKVNSKGDIGRPFQITYIDLKDGNPVAKTGQLTAKLKYQDVVAILQSNPDKYMQLQDAFFKNRVPIELAPGLVNQNIGDYVKYGAYQGILTYKNGPNCSSPVGLQNPGVSCSPYQSSGFQCVVRQLNSAGTAWQCSTTYRSLSEIPTPEPRTPNDAAKKLVDTENDFVLPQFVYSDRYGQDIDDFLKDNPTVIHFEDGPLSNVGNNPDFQLPDIPSKSAVDSSGGGGVNPGPGSPGNGGVGSAGFPASPFSPDSDGDGVPDDSDGDGVPDDGGAEEDSDGHFQAPADNTYDSGLEIPDKKSIGGLLSQFLASSPLVSLVGGISVSGSDPQPSFSVDVFGRTLVFDFSQWSGVMSGCGTAFLAVSHVGAIFLVFRRED